MKSYICAENYVHIEYNQEGKQRIKDAVETMEAIMAAVGGVTSCDYCEELHPAIVRLKGILDGEYY